MMHMDMRVVPLNMSDAWIRASKDTHFCTGCFVFPDMHALV